MAKVVIIKSLYEQVMKKFKGDSTNVFLHLRSLKDHPHKGKLLDSVGGILIKELKYKGFRFYFLVEGNKLKVYSAKELTELLLKFVRMSDKKHQQTTINEIKGILRKIGPICFK